jgi:hypothetical protein
MVTHAMSSAFTGPVCDERGVVLQAVRQLDGVADGVAPAPGVRLGSVIPQAFNAASIACS